MRARIETVYTLKQPLSHIGESESTTTFFNTVRILGADGPVDCAIYTGNAIRGMLRDNGAKYLLEKLNIRVPIKTFHLLFSGGSISGAQNIDIKAVKLLRDTVRLISLLGGGVGTQILAGKFTQTFAYPVCAESSRLIPDGVRAIDYTATKYSWKKLTGAIQFSRKDDGKAELGDTYILQEPEEQQVELLTGDVPKVKGKGKKTEDSEVPTQMRYEVEYLIPGTQLWHQINFDGTELELGALVSCIHHWAQNPVLGGMCGKGFGLVDAKFEIVADDGSRTDFVKVSDGILKLSRDATDAKAKYDEQLKDIYSQYIQDNSDTFIMLLEGGGRQ